MIQITYAQALLNALMGRTVSGGTRTPATERTKLADEGVPTSVTGLDIYTATNAEDTKTLNQYKAWKNKINATTYWETEDYSPYTTAPAAGKPSETYTGWKMVRNDVTTGDVSYPTTRYLGLFTAMPNADGSGFAEPYGTTENPTTYARVNLNEGYFTLDLVMKAAEANESGGAITSNVTTIYYPEIVDENWATTSTPLIGFGIFENPEPTEGEVPYLWGLLDNKETVTAETEHIPVFRTGEFTLSMR